MWCAYRTVLSEAVTVVACMVPIVGLARETSRLAAVSGREKHKRRKEENNGKVAMSMGHGATRKVDL